MPSHQIRVQQNYCTHSWPHQDRDIFFENQDLKDGRKCIKCGIDWDKFHDKKKREQCQSPK